MHHPYKDKWYVKINSPRLTAHTFEKHMDGYFSLCRTFVYGFDNIQKPARWIACNETKKCKRCLNIKKGR
jgi:hypothetical protein